MAMRVRCSIPEAHTMTILCVAFNSDRCELFSGSEDCVIKVWDVDTGKYQRTLQGHQNWVVDIVYAASVQILFSCSLDGNIIVWSDRGKLLQVQEFGGPVHSLAFEAKRKILVAGGRGVVQLFRVLRSSANYVKKSSSSKAATSGQARFLQLSCYLCNHKDIVQSISCAENGRIFTTSYDKKICFFDSEKPRETLKEVTKCHTGGISASAYDTDSKWLLTGCYDGTLKIWSQEGHCLDIFQKLCDSSITSVAFIAATRCYWVTSKSGNVNVIDPQAPANVTEWVMETSSFHQLSLSKIHHAVSKNVVFGITYQREIIVWRYNHFSTHRLLRGHIDWVESMVIATRRPAKDRLFAAPAAQASRGSRTTLKDRLAQQRREADLIRKKSSNLLKQKLSSVAADNPALAAILAASSQRPSTSGGTTAQNSNTVTPRRSTSAQGPRSAELKQDLSTESRSGQVTEKLTPGRRSSTKTTPRSRLSIPTPRSSLDSQKQLDILRQIAKKTAPQLETTKLLPEVEVYSGSSDGSILKWIPNTDICKDIWSMQEFAQHRARNTILCMIHHPTLDVIITGSEDTYIRIWNLDGHSSAAKMRDGTGGPDVLQGHADKVIGLAACKNMVLMSVSHDRCLRWWDLVTRLPLEIIDEADEMPIEHMEYSESREEIAICGGDNVVRVWDVVARKQSYALAGCSGCVKLVKWCSGTERWVTAATDGTISIWDAATRVMIHTNCYKKEAITALLVDEVNGRLLVSYMFDFTITAYTTDLANEEMCSYTGHTDQVHAILHLSTRNQYLSASWDRTVRVWLTPELERKPEVPSMLVKEVQGPKRLEWDAPDKEAEPKYMSAYERAHPLIMPAILQKAVLKRKSGTREALGLSEFTMLDALTRPKGMLTPRDAGPTENKPVLKLALIDKLLELEKRLQPPRPVEVASQ